MSAAAMPQPPSIPPRPVRNQNREDNAPTVPKVPPRPAGRRAERPISPEDRFAQSPLNENNFKYKGPKPTKATPNHGGHGYAEDPIERSSSVTMPSVGEEGTEYAAVTEELKEERAASPEHTRTVGQDLKLHAPKPSLPAQSAKQRVAAVTRTDSDRAASFGIGRPSSEEPTPSKGSIKKKASVTSQLSASERDFDEEHGIPEIGQRVPMYPNAGDVQAPSPAPPTGSADSHKRHHVRRISARGEHLPPGSYGLHGHGVTSPDKLDKAYYEKHPDVLHKEHAAHYHDRQHDFALTSTELNKIVRDTASRGAGLGTSPALHGTPSEEIGFQAHEEYTSRISSPRPASATPNVASPSRDSFKPGISVSKPPSDDEAEAEKETIHIDDRSHRRSLVAHLDEEDTIPEEEGEQYHAPILAEDEVSKDPSPYNMQAAVEPPPERRGSVFEIEDPPSRPSSRPSSIYNQASFHEYEPTPLEDVQEYEPLFSDEAKEKEAKGAPADKTKARHTFPSKDVWEDAPNSVHYTTEVLTPDVTETKPKRLGDATEKAETPAHAFAKHHEELAEKEARHHSAAPAPAAKSTWLPLQPVVEETKQTAPHRFPSRDLWEDAPESHLPEAEVSTPQQADSKPSVPPRPAKKLTDPTAGDKPAIPERPKPKHTTSDDGLKAKPAVSDKPKPQVPARPTRAAAASASEEKESEVGAKAKPAVPVRPAGGKIAALQAGFMSDLNKRLQLGPQAPKKEEAAAPEEPEEAAKEKAPLTDARKGRARGPQRRAPGKSPSPAVELKMKEAESQPTLSLSTPQTLWSIDPDDCNLSVAESDSDKPEAEGDAESKPELEPEPEAVKETEPPEATKTLAANTAGETIVEAKIEGDDEGVNPVEVEEVAKD